MNHEAFWIKIYCIYVGGLSDKRTNSWKKKKIHGYGIAFDNINSKSFKFKNNFISFSNKDLPNHFMAKHDTFIVFLIPFLLYFYKINIRIFQSFLLFNLTSNLKKF